MVFLELLLAVFLFVGGYVVTYEGIFYTCFHDDVDFHYGKTRMRNRRKRQKGFWRKFLFLDVRKELVPWHYAMFWINLISSVPALVLLGLYVAFRSEPARIGFCVFFALAEIACATLIPVRWRLYLWNKVRSKKSYRKNNRRS